MGKVLNALNKSNGVKAKGKAQAKSSNLDAVSEAVRQATERAVEKLAATKIEKPAAPTTPAASAEPKVEPQAAVTVAQTPATSSVIDKPEAAPKTKPVKPSGLTTIVTPQAQVKAPSVKTRITPQVVAPEAAAAKAAMPKDATVETSRPVDRNKTEQDKKAQVKDSSVSKSVSRAVNRADRLATIRASRGPVATRQSHYFSPLVITHSKPRCQISEQFRQIRTALIRLANRGPVRCMITSSQPREGKTVTAVNMAYCFSEITKKNTLLIDADLRRGRVADMFGMGRKYGLSELLNGDCSIEDATWSAGRSNFHVITAGAGSIDQIGEMLAGEQAEQVMTNLSRMYDNIIIDSPPIISVADPAILCRWVDMSLMAVRIHSTHRKLIEQATQILESVGVHVTGLIALDEKSTQRNYYRYASYG